MTDFSFNIVLWSAWRDVIFWSLTILGALSSIVAFFSFKSRGKNNTTLATFLLMIGLLFMLGLFPIEWGLGTDRANYGLSFNALSNYSSDWSHNYEGGFAFLTRLLSKFLNVKEYMFVLTAIYLGNYLWAIRRLVKKQSYWLAIVVILSMGFTTYILNTMRAGLALSFVILGVAMYPDKWKMLACLLLGTSIHTSSAIPAIMIGICYFFHQTRFYYYLWFLSIPLSFVAGDLFTNLFVEMGADDRSFYLVDVDTSTYKTGFRIDFILYSMLPIIVGGYYILRKGFNDQLYTLIYNAYILTNIFWILVIRANYSDRFAYLSWCLIPFVLAYPLIKGRLSIKENVWMSLIIIGETIFRALV